MTTPFIFPIRPIRFAFEFRSYTWNIRLNFLRMLCEFNQVFLIKFVEFFLWWCLQSNQIITLRLSLPINIKLSTKFFKFDFIFISSELFKKPIEFFRIETYTTFYCFIFTEISNINKHFSIVVTQIVNANNFFNGFLVMSSKKFESL